MSQKFKARRHSRFRKLFAFSVHDSSRQPGTKSDKLTNLEVPAWSSSLLACFDNPSMVLCGLTGIGVCVIHGHNQDAMTSGGCCFSCCIGTMTLLECGRQRRYLRKRYLMSGGEYLCPGWLGDCIETLCCMPLAICQQAREIEIRSKRKWHWLRGFRGIGETTYVGLLGEESLENVTVPFVEDTSGPAWYETTPGLKGGSDGDSGDEGSGSETEPTTKPEQTDSMDQ